MENIFLKDYKGNKLDLTNVKDELIKLLLQINEILQIRHNAKIVIHCLYESGGHSEKSQHYQGKACDYHIEGLTYKNSFRAMWDMINELKIGDTIGFGCYPDWFYQGYHIDTRGSRARWGQMKFTINGKTEYKYVSYEQIQKYIKEFCV